MQKQNNRIPRGAAIRQQRPRPQREDFQTDDKARFAAFPPGRKAAWRKRTNIVRFTARPSRGLLAIFEAADFAGSLDFILLKQRGELVDIALYKQRKHHYRQYTGQKGPQHGGEFQPLALVRFGKKIFPAPAVFARAEQHVAQ